MCTLRVFQTYSAAIRHEHRTPKESFFCFHLVCIENTLKRNDFSFQTIRESFLLSVGCPRNKLMLFYRWVDPFWSHYSPIHFDSLTEFILPQTTTTHKIVMDGSFEQNRCGRPNASRLCRQKKTRRMNGRPNANRQTGRRMNGRTDRNCYLLLSVNLWKHNLMIWDSHRLFCVWFMRRVWWLTFRATPMSLVLLPFADTTSRDKIRNMRHTHIRLMN